MSTLLTRSINYASKGLVGGIEPPFLCNEQNHPFTSYRF